MRSLTFPPRSNENGISDSELKMAIKFLRETQGYSSSNDLTSDKKAS